MQKTTCKSSSMKELPEDLPPGCHGPVTVTAVAGRFSCCMESSAADIPPICNWLTTRQGYRFASIVIEEMEEEWLAHYIFYSDNGQGPVSISTRVNKADKALPSISHLIHAADWHEREMEDLFGLVFEGHPRLGEFVLHEEWPEGTNPMKKDFDATVPYIDQGPSSSCSWHPPSLVSESGAFMMPIGPIFSGFAESAHFLLETVGEDIIRMIPRFFYKYRGVEKTAEGLPADRALLLAERFSGTSAFAHSLAFCHAVEEIWKTRAPRRAVALRVMLAELERFRHHVAAIEGICSSTGLVVAASQAGILEEDILRLSCKFAGHRYLFGLNIPGGLQRDFSDSECLELAGDVKKIFVKLQDMEKRLRFSSSFLDRLEEVGTVTMEDAVDYGLVGPVARASGVAGDLRTCLPYGDYGSFEFSVPVEKEGDGYARLRILFQEAEQSNNIISQAVSSLPGGGIRQPLSPGARPAGAALGWAETPLGATFHWVRLAEDGRVARYRLTTPSFTNWHGFHLSVEGFAFQDFPIILATFGLSNAECDR
ncbi:formate hydrogenlyase subunit 5 precursor [bacterium BMS3Bbin14]|nr:formate hydrogenlyase subunit 5 precursor [bacterium BMS3Abin13]GBE53604.1 formate hydrogenlyase subunit 5 precursor [bacterium BMS3Bbin14]HDO31404.1 hypothetical protein [Desulfobacteraceae bacterium]